MTLIITFVEINVIFKYKIGCSRPRPRPMAFVSVLETVTMGAISTFILNAAK